MSLVDAYLKMGHLQLRAGEREAGKGVVRGDLTLVEQCLQSAAVLVQRNRLSGLEPLVERLGESLGEVQSALAAYPEQIIVRPRTKPILGRVASDS